MLISKPANPVDLVVINFSENNLLGEAHGKVASPIKGLWANASKVPLPGQSNVDQTIQNSYILVRRKVTLQPIG